MLDKKNTRIDKKHRGSPLLEEAILIGLGLLTFVLIIIIVFALIKWASNHFDSFLDMMDNNF